MELMSILLSRIKRNYKLSKLEDEERPLLNRLALHSQKLGWTNPSGQKQSLEAELPKDISAVLQQLKKVKIHPTK
jgi:23S rRNA pseudouridine955/2504/2580 synthase/23S rRNA pseudouridine1911/1915/1917 synthase